MYYYDISAEMDDKIITLLTENSIVMIVMHKVNNIILENEAISCMQICTNNNYAISDCANLYN